MCFSDTVWFILNICFKDNSSPTNFRLFRPLSVQSRTGSGNFTGIRMLKSLAVNGLVLLALYVCIHEYRQPTAFLRKALKPRLNQWTMDVCGQTLNCECISLWTHCADTSLEPQGPDLWCFHWKSVSTSLKGSLCEGCSVSVAEQTAFVSCSEDQWAPVLGEGIPWQRGYRPLQGCVCRFPLALMLVNRNVYTQLSEECMSHADIQILRNSIGCLHMH